MARIGLFFGSFNPIHIGHMIIAQNSIGYPFIDEIWFVVSPHNPFKNKSSLAPAYDRLHLAHLATEDNYDMKASDIEFQLSQPSYTVHTLSYLKEKYPQHSFSLLMGSDNLKTLHKWKNYQTILDNYNIYIYDRPLHEIDIYNQYDSIKSVSGPLIYVSASYIRDRIKQNLSIRYLVPEPVYKYLDKSHLYR